MQKRKNLIFVVVDSVRTYRTGADDRDRLDIMDEFALESVEFLNAFVSAPSSILSGAAMFTGMPSCFVSRHFDDWQFDPEVIISLQNALADNGYTSYAIHNSKEDREKMRDLIHPISHKYFPKGVSHGKWWTNRQVNLILENVLKLGVQEPALFMLWYDCRRDPLVSAMVKQGLQLFKDYDLYHDSVIAMTSDHGYPDPRTGLSEATMRNTRHDMVVTDDNIRVPLLIKYPGCRPHKVNDMVGLIDLFPTLLHLLDVKCTDPRVHNVQGRDLYDLLEGRPALWEDRLIRSDTRLALAPGRVTALRTNKYKYVFFHDENTEALFDLEQDPWELHDLLDDPSPEVDVLRSRFREKLEQLQDELNQFHIDELRTAFDRNVRKMRGKGFKRMLFLSVAPMVFMDIITKSFRATFPDISIHILAPKHRPLASDMEALFDRVITVERVDSEMARRALQEQKLSRYDVALVITEKSSIGFDDPAAYKAAKILGKRVLMADYNMKFYSRFLSRWVWPLRRYRRNWELYRQEPLLLFSDMLQLARAGIRYLILNKRPETPDMVKAKKMRDRALLAKKEALARQHERH